MDCCRQATANLHIELQAMKKTNLVLLVIFLLPVVALGLLISRENPHVFSELSLAEAQAEAIEQDKILLVDATADWCQPCKLMERTTWVDPEVIAWIKLNAIAIQVDVDKQEAEARELRIQAMPTVILFKDGSELNRALGYSDAPKLLDWLNRQ